MCPWVITMVRALGLKWGAGEAYVEIGDKAGNDVRYGSMLADAILSS
jgi:hypothetical protein